MKLNLLVPLAFLSIISYSANAQTPDKAVAIANYNFSHLRDTTNKTQIYTETFVLLLGKNASVYRSLDKQKQADDLAKQVAAQVNRAPDRHSVELHINSSASATAEEYFQYSTQRKLYTEKKIVNYYVTEEPLPVIKWKISSDTLSFSGLHCQKAIAHFKGRNYEAWFCPELPFRNGPWKLNGLPGLIIEAYDTKKEVVFKFVGFENKREPTDIIAVPANDIKATPDELDRLVEAKRKDPVGFAKAAHGESNNSQRGNPMNNIPAEDIKSISVVSSAPRIVINNPIELPEKK